MDSSPSTDRCSLHRMHLTWHHRQLRQLRQAVMALQRSSRCSMLQLPLLLPQGRLKPLQQVVKLQLAVLYQQLKPLLGVLSRLWLT